ncbi:expressed unknown protein [Seminavis robusta]|uniref:Uncharacterized protein n=1 Tax=Seminavis robusta TaxID=568900 RepID=A0A9N8F001_9STRA|nr:expressed unknown protein [Seminavis robusta]|eukprot:Sro2293_g322270.1 n/a (158) ;mRNA; f:7936-8409
MTTDDNNNNNNNPNNNSNNPKPSDYQPPPAENSLLAQTLAAQRQAAVPATNASTQELLRRLQNGFGRGLSNGGQGAARVGPRGTEADRDRSLLQILDDAISLMDRHRARSSTDGETTATPARRSRPGPPNSNTRNTRRRHDNGPDSPPSNDKTAKGQ